jgi:hypothetical protein
MSRILSLGRRPLGLAVLGLLVAAVVASRVLGGGDGAAPGGAPLDDPLALVDLEADPTLLEADPSEPAPDPAGDPAGAEPVDRRNPFIPPPGVGGGSTG